MSRLSDQELHDMLSDCCLCPRNCHANRLQGKNCFCGQSGELTVARAALHFWEEPCISGIRGSGTVFFCGCNLKCVFCQNHEIAIGNTGKTISPEKLADIFLSLEQQGAHNINLVTPSHSILPIIRALELSRSRGLTLPIVYNTGGYEKPETLRLLDGLIDIYLPDMKYYESEPAMLYSHAPDYFAICQAALAEMFRQVGPVSFADEDGISLLKKGMLVRHLVLPGETRNAKKVLRYLKETYGNQIYISLMSQYTPLPHVAHVEKLNRRVSKEEYQKLLDFCQKLHMDQVYVQEGECAKESFIPPFDETGL